MKLIVDETALAESGQSAGVRPAKTARIIAVLTETGRPGYR